MITFPRSKGTGPAAAARPVGGGLGLVAILGGAILIAIFAAGIAVIITHPAQAQLEPPGTAAALSYLTRAILNRMESARTVICRPGTVQWSISCIPGDSNLLV